MYKMKIYKFSQTDLMVYVIILIIAFIIFNYFSKTMDSCYDKNNAHTMVFFDFNKFELDKPNKLMLKQYFSNREKQYNTICIIGHTDTVGSKKVNTRFGYLRAMEVLQCLNQLGVNATNFKIISKDYSDPISQSQSDSNRRVDIHLS